MPHKDPEVRRAYQKAWEAEDKKRNPERYKAKKLRWQEKNKEQHLAYRRDYYRRSERVHILSKQQQKRERVAQIKLGSGCVDCGFNGHPSALDFDHREMETKSFCVSQGMGKAWETILAEIEKCDVRCRNCHAIRTVEQLREWRAGQRVPLSDEGKLFA